MTKEVHEMKPRELHRMVKDNLEQFADVLLPGDSQAPILGPMARVALMDWMIELNCKEELKAAGIKPRRTALLHGPPGCGKTTFAHHFAARLGLPLALIRSESIIDKYLGSTGQNLGNLFQVLRELEGKCVVFFDEIDAIGGKRMHDQGASVERANSLTVLLRHIETFDGICFGATNIADQLDAALWRRFDMQIKIDLPGSDERFGIIRRYIAPYDMRDEEIDIIVDLTRGASPALLRNLMEGIKRMLVIGTRSSSAPQSAAAAFLSSAASSAPPPEIKPPPLWDAASTGEVIADLDKISWPLLRAA